MQLHPFSIHPVYALAENQKRELSDWCLLMIRNMINEMKRSGYGQESFIRKSQVILRNYEYVDCTWENCFDKLKNDELKEKEFYTEER